MTSSLSAGRLAPHGGSGFRGMETETGAAGAPGMRSGAVEGPAATAGRLDGQAHQVAIAVEPDMEPRPMTDAEQLAAFEAAPLRFSLRGLGFGARIAGG